MHFLHTIGLQILHLITIDVGELILSGQTVEVTV